MVLMSVTAGIVLAVASVPVAALAPGSLQWVHSGILDTEEPVSIDDGRWFGRRFLMAHVGYHTGAHFDFIDPADDPRPAFAVAPGERWYVLEYTSAGWPWLAAEGRNVRGSGPPEFLLEVTVFWKDRSIPLRPIWPGLLANTLFYATITLALLAGLRLIRTHRRRKRGRCVACNYKLGEGISVCPECGLEKTA